MPILDTAAGPIELEERGSGAPVLVVHGTPGGIDSALAMARFLPPERFRSILVSRPGYLGTPLDPRGASVDREAELLAAALDALGVDLVGVLAWSGGGPSAYRLAVLHPERVSRVVAVAALCSSYVVPPASINQRISGSAPGQLLIRLMARFAPRELVRNALLSESELRGAELNTAAAAIFAEPEQRAAVLAFATDTAPRGARRAGLANDLANFGAISSLELERVSCPVLLVHGDADSDVPFASSLAAQAALADSRLLVADRGSHFALFARPDAPRLQREVCDFLAAR